MSETRGQKIAPAVKCRSDLWGEDGKSIENGRHFMYNEKRLLEKVKNIGGFYCGKYQQRRSVCPFKKI